MIELPRYTKGAQLALEAVKHQIDYGIAKLDRFTETDEYVALDIARCTLEGIIGGDNPNDEAYDAVRRWRHEASPWSAARA